MLFNKVVKGNLYKLMLGFEFVTRNGVLFTASHLKNT
ncbi:Uncharacterized protein XB15_01091 [Leptospira santarosai]|nr:Uncharacterized protein XB15_01091 [Leptospira santarosai]